ncbi:hypothetical protein EC957_009895 [Mortierella hygrophila]|uniref:Uncharacterized protein n=1 Tax=Mortierella hygrophila TaxID=979708 RepID=A0A9P6FBF7_9FUNG|nr:hypothetical protein EC957_009895 [Mortierella hygrophila]
MNALVSYASDSDTDSDSGDLHPTTTTITATDVQKTASPTTVSTPTAATASSSAAPSKHHTPEGTPVIRTPDLQEEINTQQEIQEERSQQQEQPGGGDDDDDFVSAALKDLQSFAASVDDSTTTSQQDDGIAMPVSAPQVEEPPSVTAIAAVSGTQPSQASDQPDSTDMDVDQTDTAIAASTTATTVPPQPPSPIELTTEQQIIFDTFLQEINAIPLLPLPSTNQPPLPPLPPGASTSISTASLSLTSTALLNDDDDHWIQAQTPQTIYSRIHQLSTLPQTDRFNPKEVENRLIEFAIRLLDWEQGGLKPVYFLGEERAIRELESRRRDEERSGEGGIDDEVDLQGGSSLPRYSGVVGEMIEFMHTIEKIAPSDDHWTVVWNRKELSYGFFHPATGTKSEESPSTELRNRLNPPSTTSGITTPTIAT